MHLVLKNAKVEFNIAIMSADYKLNFILKMTFFSAYIGTAY